MTDFEKYINNNINNIITSHLHGDFALKSADSPEEKAQKVYDYLIDGADKGYSTFFTYRRLEQVKIQIMNNYALALTSDDPFVRAFAILIKKQLTTP